MATLVPSGDPPSTTARTPSWRRTAWASVRSASGSTLSRRATTTPPSRRPPRPTSSPRPRSTAGAAAPAPARRRAGARPSGRWPPTARRAPCATARRPTGPAAPARGPAQRRVARSSAKIRRVFEPDRALREQRDRADLAQRVDVGAAAELERARPRLHDAHRRAVLVAEEGDGAHRLGLVARGLDRLDAHSVEHGVGWPSAKTSSSSSRVGCAWCEKSKRRYSGADAASPAGARGRRARSRSAACSRCVAVWLRRMASRRSPSMVASASWPATHLAGRHAPGARPGRARPVLGVVRPRRCPSR